MDRVDCVVIGAGVIGLAVARRLAQAGREVIILEAAEGIGTVTSSRNSEVIHAGIYYPSGSLMARMCVSGKGALYEYCRDHGIPHRNCGKLIVATTEKETEKLNSIRAHAEANGVLDLKTLSRVDARALEPALNCDAALLSPSTGIIDSHAYMLALKGDAEEAGGAPPVPTPLFCAPAEAGRTPNKGGGGGPATAAPPPPVHPAERGPHRNRGRRRCADDACLRSPGQRGRAWRARGGAQHRRHAGRTDPVRLSCQGQLFQLQRAGAVLTPDLSGAGARWTRSAPYARHGRPSPFRPRRGMGREHRLCGRPRACRKILSRDPALLADAAGRRVDAELFRNPAEDRAARGRHAGFPDPGTARPWRHRTDQPVRYRIAGADVLARHRGPCRRNRKSISCKSANDRHARRAPRKPCLSDTRYFNDKAKLHRMSAPAPILR